MKVTTEITLKDLVWVNLIIIPRMRSTYINMTVFALLCFILIVWKDGLPRTDWEWVALILISICSGIGGIFGMNIWNFLAVYCFLLYCWVGHSLNFSKSPSISNY